MKMLLWALPLILACDESSSSGSGTDPTVEADDTGELAEAVPQPESDCEDGIDNDEDGSIDCIDSDCAEVFHCTWPDAISHETEVVFDGYDVECDLGWLGTYDKQINDCTTFFTAPLVRTEQGELCEACDGTFAGPITYVYDDCDDLTGDGTRPTEGRFGFRFLSETERELWSQDDSGVWQLGFTMTLQGESWSFTDSGEVQVDTGDCENSPLTVGNLTVTMTFVDE